MALWSGTLVPMTSKTLAVEERILSSPPFQLPPFRQQQMTAIVIATETTRDACNIKAPTTAMTQVTKAEVDSFSSVASLLKCTLQYMSVLDLTVLSHRLTFRYFITALIIERT